MNVESPEILRSLFVYDKSDPMWTRIEFIEGLSDQELARRIREAGPGSWVNEWAPVAEIDSYYTMLMLCIQEEWPQSAIALLELGADPSLSIPQWAREKRPWIDSDRAGDETCEVPLVRAASDSQKSVVRALLHAGADPNQIEEDRDFSALYMATGRETDIEIVKMLLEAGADPLAETQMGETPLDHSKLHGSPEVHALIAEAAKNAPRKHPVIEFTGKRQLKQIKPGGAHFGRRRWNANLDWAMIFAKADFDAVLDATADFFQAQRVIRNLENEPNLATESAMDFVYQVNGSEWVTMPFASTHVRMVRLDPLPLAKAISKCSKVCWVFQAVIVKRVARGEKTHFVEWMDEDEEVDWKACDAWFKEREILIPNVHTVGVAPHPHIEFMGIRPDTIARVAALELPKQD